MLTWSHRLVTFFSACFGLYIKLSPTLPRLRLSGSPHMPNTPGQAQHPRTNSTCIYTSYIPVRSEKFFRICLRQSNVTMSRYLMILYAVLAAGSQALAASSNTSCSPYVPVGWNSSHGKINFYDNVRQLREGMALLVLTNKSITEP